MTVRRNQRPLAHSEDPTLAGARQALADSDIRLIDSNYRRIQHEKQLATQPLLAPGYRNTETSWFDRAACKDAPDPEVFFPVSDEAKKTEPWHEFCDDCPVRKECGAFAQRRGLIGVWGGTYRPGNLLSARLRGRPRHKNKPLGSEAASVAPVAGKGAS